MPLLQTPSAYPRFETVWRIVTYLLIFIGFLAMVFTGAIHPVITTLFVMVWSYGIFHQGPPRWWRGWMSFVAFWICLLALVIYAYIARYDSILYLLLFLGIYKCYALRIPLDHLHCLIIAFFMFLVCSIITSSAAFILFMLFFILLANLELICFTISNGAAGSQPYGISGWRKPLRSSLRVSRYFLRRLAVSSIFITIVVLMLSFGLFLVIPHYAVQAFDNPWGAPLTPDSAPASSGYTDDLKLGRVDRINLDETLVMKVQTRWMDPDAKSTSSGTTKAEYPSSLRLRGLSLDSYDENNQRWTHASREKTSTRWEEINLGVLDSVSGLVLEQQIRQNMMLTSRLFGAPTPFRFRIHRGSGLRLNFEWPMSLRVMQAFDPNVFMGNQQLSYTVYSRFVNEATPLLYHLQDQQWMNGSLVAGQKLSAEDDSTTAPMPEWLPRPLESGLTLNYRERLLNTQLPRTEFGDRLIATSNQVALGENPATKLLQLLDWFQRDFEYTLTPDTPGGMNPIEAFLYKTRKGHCEYFASAFTLLVRAQHIPARVVVGYFTTEWDRGAHSYLVRQSDAHAWAEVWMEGWGWLTLDPTPPAMRGRSSIMDGPKTTWGRLGTSLGSYWRQYIIDYSQLQQQRFIAKILSSRAGHLMYRSLHRFEQTRRSISRNMRNSNHHSWQNIQILWIAVGVASLGAVVGLLFALRAWLRRHRRQAFQVRSSISFINQVFGRLEAHGWRRGHGETTAEFLRSVDGKTDSRWLLSPLIDIYHRVRYSNQPLTSADKTAVRQALQRLK